MITANVIHNSARLDRGNLMLKEALEQDYEIRQFNAVIMQPPKTGISKAHKNVIRFAKENNMEWVLVLEDDCHFTDKGALQHFIDTIPEDFDIYLGGVCIKEPIPEDRTLEKFCCMHCYIVHSRFYDTFLGVRETTDIDNALAGLGKYIVCYPFIAVQHTTPSNNSHATWSFSDYLTDKKLWKNEQ